MVVAHNCGHGLQIRAIALKNILLIRAIGARFAIKNKCSLKGIIDYEIAKKLGKNEFIIPIYYPKDSFLSERDASMNNYSKIAIDTKNNTKKYIEENTNRSIMVEEITTKSGFYGNLTTTKAYKIKFFK